MYKNIIILILLLVSAVLAWLVFTQKKKPQKEDEMISYYLGFHHKEILETAEYIVLEVEDEIANEGKMENEGLIDTVESILQDHNEMLRSGTLTEQDAINNSNRLSLFWNFQLKPFHNLEDYAFPETNWKEYEDGGTRAWRLMQLELQLLNLINGKVGVRGFWVPKFSPVLHYMFEDTVFLYAQDTMRVQLSRSWPDPNENNRDVYLDLKYPDQSEWEVSKGWVSRENGYRYWNFLQDSIPENGVFQATLSGKMWKATGGYEQLFPQKKIFKVVR
jgi:hypothetical protein